MLDLMPRADEKARRLGKRLSERSRKEQDAAYRILYGRRARRGPESAYDPEVHPAGIIDYFRESFDALGDSEQINTVHGDRKYVHEPLRVPTLAGYAATIGISREMLWSWAGKYPELEEAIGICKAMQEQIIVELSAKGSYPPQVFALMMKNLHGWADKVEQKSEGVVTLVFDAQDRDA